MTPIFGFGAVIIAGVLTETGARLFRVYLYSSIGTLSSDIGKTIRAFAIGTCCLDLGHIFGMILKKVLPLLKPDYMVFVVFCLVYIVVVVGVTALYGFSSRKHKKQEAEESSNAEINQLLSALRIRCRTVALENGLTPREEDVLYCLAQGWSNNTIAEELSLSQNTIKTHIRHIYNKLDISSREEAQRKIIPVITQNG